MNSSFILALIIPYFLLYSILNFNVLIQIILICIILPIIYVAYKLIKKSKVSSKEWSYVVNLILFPYLLMLSFLIVFTIQSLFLGFKESYLENHQFYVIVCLIISSILTLFIQKKIHELILRKKKK